MSSPPHGGKKRRGSSAWLAAIAIALAPLAVAAAAYVTLIRPEAHGGVTLPDTPPPAPPPKDGPGAAVSPLEGELARPLSLSEADAFRLRVRKPLRAGLVFDLDSGKVLWRRRPLKRLPMASLTKIMTALLVTERAGPEERVKIDRATLRYQGSGVGVLPRGKRVRLETLMNGLLLVSGNDAAIALADHVSRTERRFVALMNARARKLGLRCTRFASSHGLEPGNQSCARDLAVMAQLAMSDRRITRIARRRQVSFRFPIKGRRLFLSGHNPLIRAGYKGAIGLKTGYTDEAGRCFVGVARRDGHTLGVVLLNSANPMRHAEALLDAGFRAVS
jgi:serine-type D-Ala-D-Ala carboxypeptidase (penicillin-binding protein 5/6)